MPSLRELDPGGSWGVRRNQHRLASGHERLASSSALFVPGSEDKCWSLLNKQRFVSLNFDLNPAPTFSSVGNYNLFSPKLLFYFSKILFRVFYLDVFHATVPDKKREKYFGYL